MAPKKSTKKPRAKPRAKRNTLAKAINNVLAKQVEVKSYFNYAANQSITTAVAVGGVAYPTALSMSPLIFQGVGESQRIGNMVNVKSAYIKGRINLLPYNVTSNPFFLPCLIKIWLVSYKLTNTVVWTNTNANTSFFDTNNSSVGFQGNVLDTLLEVNRECYTVHGSKTFKLGTGSQTTLAAGYTDNSSFTAPFSFSYGKYLSKLKYDDAAIASPTNKSLFLVFQAVPADGSGAGAPVPAEFHFTNTVRYTDM